MQQATKGTVAHVHVNANIKSELVSNAVLGKSGGPHAVKDSRNDDDRDNIKFDYCCDAYSPDVLFAIHHEVYGLAVCGHSNRVEYVFVVDCWVGNEEIMK